MQHKPYSLPRALRLGRLVGYDDLEDALAGIQQELEAQRKAAEGGNTDASTRVAQLEDQVKRIQEVMGKGGGGGDNDTGGGTTPPDAAEALRKELATYRMRDMASTIATSVVERVREAQAAEEKQLADAVQQQVAKMLGHDTLGDAVAATLKGMRDGSRYAGPGAAQDVLEALAAGGSVRPPAGGAAGGSGDTPITVRARGLDELRKSKHPLGEYVRGIFRLKSGTATEAERQYVAEVHAKAMAQGTPSAGGYLVPDEYLDDILGLLRAQAVVRRAGAREVGFNKSLSQTTVSTGSTAYYTAENAQIQTSELTFGQAPLLSPHNLTGMVPVSNYLLNNAPEAERIVRQDMTEVIALREDLAFLRGTGGGGEPRGLRNLVGITLDPIASPANGFQPSLMDLRQIRARFRSMNVANPRPVWFFNGAFITYLETLADSEGRPLLESALLNINADGMSGTIDGVTFFATNQIPINLTQGGSTNATDLMLVDINTVLIGNAQALELDVSNQASYWDGSQWVSSYQDNQSVFRGILSHDITARRPAQVIVQRGVLV